MFCTDKLAVQELSNETAATLQGGASVYHTRRNPDIMLFEHANGRGRWLGIKATRAGVGDQNIGITKGEINGFNDQVSFIKVIRGTWDLYEHEKYGGAYIGRVKAGGWNNGKFSLPGWMNDRITSILRVA